MVKQSTAVRIAEEQVDDSKEAQLMEKDDYGYELWDEIDLDDENSDDEGNLGAKDSEEPWDMDNLHAEGFDEL